ncbi:TonB-dependent receptor [Campylobacter blaseri]|uniref:TonB-dependent receptor plug domain-containing protein n=1 Tax=Campylobacter blaseri TaxID=2042961 RepID=A0A2P8R194_9BACT|nr:TonB-dependent receptor plug domain-containing protein [Campylobacter blaseri]PSM52270.1 hypothetical protein CQ405_04240 [Campylobacter blaseri]PSM54036.1 hypothetical protein CRN67_04240 [Campylobacter blaseri]QKF85477.1 TonB-dependent receptor [Campylobacter blaseri]
MKNLIKIELAIVLLCNIMSVVQAKDESVILEATEVVGQKFKEKDKAYMKSGAVSIRDEINKQDKDLDAVIRSAPGTFTQMNKASGAVSVNIRGGTGFGRVNTMVDGVTQTFYSSGGDTGGKGGAGSQFGASIDPAFLTSVEINRGSFKGAGGSNALMGSANFKTIGVDDILRFDRNIGGMIRYQNGNNDMKPEYMVALAGKSIFDYGGWLGVLYGYSRKTITQNYKIGGGETHKERMDKKVNHLIDKIAGAGGWFCRSGDQDCIDNEVRKYNVVPFDPEKVKQKPENHIFKIEYGDDYNILELQYRKGTNHLAGRSIENDTKQINYNFSIPDNNFMNLNLLYSKNENSQNYDIGSSIINRTIIKPLKGYNKSTIFDISNTFEFNFPFDTTLNITTGVNRLENKYSRNRYPDELRIYKICEEDEESDNCLVPNGEINKNVFTEEEKINASLPTNSFFPQGNQKFKTLYLDNQLKWNMFTLDYNINLVRYKNRGESFKTTFLSEDDLENRWEGLNDTKDFLKDELDDATSPEIIKNLNEQLNNVQKRINELNKHWDFSNNEWKAPVINVTDHYNEVKNNFVNYSMMLTANINDYFIPFIGYSKTHRAPTIQEMFFSSLGDAGVNLGLKPETAKTKQIGFNGFLEGAFTDNDKIGYKFTGYKTKINNFIHNASDYRNIGIKLSDGDSAYVKTIYHRNYDQLVTIKGFEAEFSYDMGTFFANIAYARQKTNQPASYSDISRTAQSPTSEQADAQSFGLTKVTILPNSYGSIELGTRLFDQKLTLGTVIKYYGKSKRSKYETVVMCEGGIRAISKKDVNPISGIVTYRPPQCPRIKDKYGNTTGNQYKRVGEIAEYEEVESQPIIYDLYAIYEPNKNLMIKLAIDNLTDEKYVNPLDANNDSASQYIVGIQTAGGSDKNVEFFQNNFARGRTFKLSFSYKF